MKFNSLIDLQKEIAVLQSIQGHLRWDRDVNLPVNSEVVRTNQEQLIEALIHQKYSSQRFQENLQSINRNDLSSKQKRELYLIEREAAIKTCVPEKFITDFIELQNQTYSYFKKAKESSDFSIVEKYFSKLVDRYLEMPNFLKSNSFLVKDLEGLSDYEIMITAWDDPGVRNNFLKETFEPLRNFLIEARRNLPTPKENKYSISWDSAKLLDISNRVCRDIGFDFSKGRIDITTIHPFCGGSLGDTRITTKVEPNSPIDGLMSTLHEVGHGIYQQNLPEEYMFSPLGNAPSAAVHESQSRFIENQIARSKPFIKYLSKVSGESVEILSDLMLSRRQTFIRVDADEIDYNLHIMLRWELEQAIVSGSLKVKDIPDAWNELYLKYFGDVVPDDRHGCLQDIHWYGIGFGYFPSYCLGNIIAAQLFATFEVENPDWESKVESGNLIFVNKWLKEKIHSHGARFDTIKTAENAFGSKKIDPNYLIKYLSKKYLD